MCPVKTENMALNVPREEAKFWGRLAVKMTARSRADLQKSLLLAALEKINVAAAKELREIRESYKGKPLRPILATMMLLIFCGTLFTHDSMRRPARRFRSENLIEEHFAAGF